MITLNVVDALGKIDPSLEEAAQSVGARGWRKFWTVTLPLTTPGYIAGALLVFIWTFSDFATPLDPRRAGPARAAGVPQHRAVRRSAHLPHGHRDLRADGDAGDRVPARRAALRRPQGLRVAVLLARRAPAPVRGAARARRRVPVARDAAVVHPVHRRGARVGRQGLGPDAAPRRLHARVLRARDRRDAEVHREQLPLQRARRGALHRRRRPDRVDPRPHRPCRARGARRGEHADPRDPRHRHRHRVHPRLPLRAAGARPGAHVVLDRPAARARRAAPARTRSAAPTRP